MISSNSITLTLIKSVTHASFEAAQASFSTQSLTTSVIYHTPNSTKFIHELTANLHFIFLTLNHFIKVKDFNIPNCHDLDNPLNILLRKHGIVKHINFQSHRLGNTFDLVITPVSSFNLISDPASEVFKFDHFFLWWRLNLVQPHLSPHGVTVLSFKNLNMAALKRSQFNNQFTYQYSSFNNQ